MSYTVQDVIEALRSSSTVAEATEKMGMTGHSSLGRILRRNGMGVPTDYLGKSSNARAPFPETVEEFRSTCSDIFGLDGFTDEDGSVFAPDPVVGDANNSEDLRREVCTLYASQKVGGCGMTKREVANALSETWGVTEDDVAEILEEEGQTKATPPVIRADMHRDVQDLSDDIREIKRNHVAKARRERALERELESVREDLEKAREYYRLVRDNLKADSEHYFSSKPDMFADAERVRIIPISDVHVGAKTVVGRTESRHFNPYNIEVLQDKVDEIKRRIMEDDGPDECDAVLILGLGDLFEAIFGNMRRGQHLEMDTFGFEQYRVVKSMLLEIVQTCLDWYPPETEIKLGLQAGNHDRIFADKSYNSQHAIIKILVDSMRDALQGTGTEVFYMDPIFRLNVNGTGLITFHGDLFKLRGEKDVAQLLMNHSVEGAERHLLLQGHVHRFTLTSGSKYRHITLPSICENTDFERHQLKKSTDSEFIMIDVYPDHSRIVGPFPL